MGKISPALQWDCSLWEPRSGDFKRDAPNGFFKQPLQPRSQTTQRTSFLIAFQTDSAASRKLHCSFFRLPKSSTGPTGWQERDKLLRFSYLFARPKNLRAFASIAAVGNGRILWKYTCQAFWPGIRRAISARSKSRKSRSENQKWQKDS